MNVEGLIERENRLGTRYYEDNEGQILAKRCSKCVTVKDISKFSKDKRKCGGFKSLCKACVSLRYEENKEAISKRAKLYYKENKDAISERKKLYYEENKHVRALYYKENKDAISERMKLYYEENKSEYAARSLRWCQNNMEKKVIIAQRRRARKAFLPDDFTAEQQVAMSAYFNGACALSDATEDIHLDHAVAIATGHGGTTVGNMVPLNAALNMSKKDRHLFEWFDANKERFGLEQARFDRTVEYLARHNDMTPTEYRRYVDECYANKSEAG